METSKLPDKVQKKTITNPTIKPALLDDISSMTNSNVSPVYARTTLTAGNTDGR